MKTLNGANLRKLFTYGYGLLDKNREAVDSLNVFPVPDGDTGINMSLTLKSVIKELDLISSNETSAVCEAIAKGALKGARGNSGVILSQILKGILTSLSAVKTSEITPKHFAESLKNGSDTAYRAVTVPREGTILTVIRVMSEEAKSIAKKSDDFVQFFTDLIAVGEDILAQTPDMLPVLKKAGVVDAGGKGLIIMFMGFLACVKGEDLPDIIIETQKPILDDDHSNNLNLDLGEIEFAYCTQFIIQHMHKTTTTATIDSFREKLMRIGDSVACVGDISLVNTHVHTNNPGEALSMALTLGEITDIKIENMLEQNRELRAKQNIAEKDQGIVAVASGEGIITVFKDLGVDYVIKGGQTMNPSAEDIAEAVRRVHAKNIFIFPNNSNIILACKHAQALTDKNLIVIPTKSINEGITACIAFNPEASIEENTEQFLAMSESVKSGSVTYASRTTKMNGFSINQGDIIGLNNKAILSKAKNPNEAAIKLVEKMMDDETVNITIFYGEDVKDKEANALQDKLVSKLPNCEVNLIYGGQPVYYYLISLE